MSRDIPIAMVRPNPDQPRKEFDDAKLRELAASIAKKGLQQPIGVRPATKPKGYVIVFGERRYRAHLLNGAKTISARVSKIGDSEADEIAIIENLQRVDISPIEEAHAYQRMLDTYGYTVEQLAKRLGIKQSWRITERISLLRLQPEYLALLRSKQVTPSQAYEMSRLSDRGQNVLFHAINRGNCPTYDALRATATALVEAESQGAFFDENEAPAPTKAEIDRAMLFERKIEKVADLLNTGIRDNEIIAVQKVDPDRAETMAQLLAEMQKSLKAIELALRQSAACMALR